MVEADPELARYYRSLIHSYAPSFTLQPSKHGSHITVIAGKYETIPLSHASNWKKYNGMPVVFFYSPSVETDGVYFWLPVFCEEFVAIRTELGLNPTIPIPWHLTIGNLKGNMNS